MLGFGSHLIDRLIAKPKLRDRMIKLGYEAGINTFDMSDIEAADKAIEAIADLNRRIGIPKSLAEVGIKEDQLCILAKKAFEDPCHQSNPRPCTEQDLLMLYKEAFKQS